MEERTRKVRKTKEQLQAEAEARARKAAEQTVTDAISGLPRAFVVGTMNSVEMAFVPVRILKNGPATVVFWQDGSKTVVKPGPDVTPNEYDAFTAALAIRIFGNNSRLKKLIRVKTAVVKPKARKVVQTIVEDEVVKPVGEYRLNPDALEEPLEDEADE